ncbi:hypothetical protein [Lysinibacillus sp. UBA5990]|nr:hypothetical protein [Lysinibacillus sp. UBA5990]
MANYSIGNDELHKIYKVSVVEFVCTLMNGEYLIEDACDLAELTNYRERE